MTLHGVVPTHARSTPIQPREPERLDAAAIAKHVHVTTYVSAKNFSTAQMIKRRERTGPV